MKAKESLVTAVLALTAALSTGGPVAAELSWRLDVTPPAPECGLPTAVELACGSWGDYQLSAEETFDPECSPSTLGVEIPSPHGLTSLPLPALTTWFPCRDGSCLSDHAQGPWVAVIDWADAHGWSVAHTVLQAADFALEAELYAIDQPPAELGGVIDAFSIGDAHLLVQLCRLAERIEAEPDHPPLAVNISAGRVGRLRRPGDEEIVDLSAQVEGLIDHLATAYAITFVAAGGHHRELLFPASLDSVLAVGAFNVAKLRNDGMVWRSWLSTRDVTSLFPGYGFELRSPTDPEACWPAPPGSSYAAATASGWIAAYRAQGGGWLDVDAQACWAPMSVDGRFFLSRDQTPLDGTDLAGPTALVQSAVDGDRCGAGIVDPSLTLQVMEEVEATNVPLRQALSLPQLVAEFGASPENDPCVPCLVPPQRVNGAAPLQLSQSHPLPAELELNDLFLVMGGTVYTLESVDKAEILSKLSHAELPAVALEGLDSRRLRPSHEAFLLYLFESEGHPYWHSTPIDLLP